MKILLWIIGVLIVAALALLVISLRYAIAWVRDRQ